MSADAGRPWVAHYAPGVPTDIEIPGQRIPDLVGEAARRWPTRSALVFHGVRTSYRRLWEESGRFAAALYRDGFRAGDRLALYLPNVPTYVVAYLGALRLGVTVVQVSPLYIGQDLSHLLADARPRGLVCLEIHHPNLAKLAPAERPPIVYVARLRDSFPVLLRPFVNGRLRRTGLTTEMPHGAEVRPFRPALRDGGEFPPGHGDPAAEIAVLQYTGGTTGRPKAAMLTHRNLIANVLQCRAWFRADPGSSVVLASIPFFHIYGLTVALNYPLFEGATILLELRPEPKEILRLIARYHPTQFPAVPALYQAINQHPDASRYDLKGIRACLSGSAPLPLEVKRRFEELTGATLVEGYGLTETSPVTHANPIGGEQRAGSIGLPLPGTDQRIVDAATGAGPLATGEVGELAIRGPQVMAGYLGQPEETAMVLKDGWLVTGDLARVDADGYCYIVDRKKDMVDVGGLKVFPREVDEVLYQHPDIAEAAVVGVPDAELGEVIKAFVVVKPGRSLTEEAVIAFVRERIAHYKAPRSVEFRTELPRSGVQKVLRRVLREGAAAPSAATAPAR